MGRVVAVSPSELVVVLDGDAAPALGAACVVDRATAEAPPCRALIVDRDSSRVRCAPIESTNDVTRGAAVTLVEGPDARSLLASSATAWTLRASASARIETGIPVIDELAPLGSARTAALVGLDHVPCAMVANDLLSRLAADASRRMVLVGARHVVASCLDDGPPRAPIVRCGFDDGGLPGAVLLALARALDFARETAPPRTAFVFVAGANAVQAALSSLGLRSSTSVIDLFVDALALVDATSLLCWTTPADELDDDPLYRQLARALHTTLALDRELATRGARWPIDPLRSTSRTDAADPQGALEQRALLARARTIREERLPLLGRDQLDPNDRIDLAHATNGLHRLVGLPMFPEAPDIIQ